MGLVDTGSSGTGVCVFSSEGLCRLSVGFSLIVLPQREDSEAHGVMEPQEERVLGCPSPEGRAGHDGMGPHFLMVWRQTSLQQF